METTRFTELLAKRFSGDITVEEMNEFNQLASENHAESYIEQIGKEVWEIEFRPAIAISDAYKKERWASLNNRLKADVVVPVLVSGISNFRRRFQFGVAASILLALFLLIMKGYKIQQQPIETKPNIVSTKNGSRTKLQMPDGTQVWLNAGSRLTYSNESFGKSLREVELTGEAFFDVVKDKQHPFIVHTRNMDIKVIGTAFNVRSYPGDNQSEATLLRGQIEVSFKNKADKIILTPNEKISVSNEDSTDSKEAKTKDVKTEDLLWSLSKLKPSPEDSVVNETAWIKNVLRFRSKSFEEVAKDLERWYNVTIEFKSSELKKHILTGTFTNETITDALNYLQLTAGFKYDFNKATNTIMIYQ